MNFEHEINFLNQKKQIVMATIKFFLPLFLLLNVTMTTIAAQNESKAKVWIIISYVKENSKMDYEKWMTDIFWTPMKTTQDPLLKKQFAATRWLTPARQNEDKTWTYCFIMDPIIENGNYDIDHYLVKTYGETKGKVYLQEYEGFMAFEGQFHAMK